MTVEPRAGAAGVSLASGLRTLAEPPPVLVAAIEVWNRGERVRASDELQGACEQRLAELAPHIAPARPERIAGWLAKLADGLVNAPKGEDLSRATSAIVEACADLPSRVWVAETRVAYWRSCKFWPAPFDLYDHLAGPAAAIRLDQRRAETMLRLCRAPRATEPEPPREVPESERQAVAARWRELATATGAQMHVALEQPAVARPSPASDRALLATLEGDAAAGRPGAAERVKALRTRMGLPIGAETGQGGLQRSA